MQQLSKADTPSISEKEESLFNFKRFSCAQNVPLAFVITMKHSAMSSVLPVFVFSALLAGGKLVSLAHLETCFFFYSVTSPPRIYALPFITHLKSVMYKPRAYSRNFTVFNLCFTIALQWLTT